MWMVILTTLGIAFASGLSMGSSLERGRWESAIKDQLNRLDARFSRHARRARRAGRQAFAAPNRPVKKNAGRCNAATAA